MKLSELKKSSPAKLLEIAESMGIENISRAKKQTLIFSILKAKAEANEEVVGDGILDVIQDGYGFLRSPDDSYVSGPDDIYVSLIRSEDLICPLVILFQATLERQRKVKNIWLW